MTGPKATPPRWKKVKATTRRSCRVVAVPQHLMTEGRRIVRFDEKSGNTLILHPTKGLRHVG